MDARWYVRMYVVVVGTGGRYIRNYVCGGGRYVRTYVHMYVLVAVGAA